MRNGRPYCVSCDICDISTEKNQLEKCASIFSKVDIVGHLTANRFDDYFYMQTVWVLDSELSKSILINLCFQNSFSPLKK